MNQAQRALLVLALGALPLACKSSTSKNPQGEGQHPPAKGDETPSPVVPAKADAGPLVLAPAPPLAPTPLGLPPAGEVSYNPTTPEKVALGRLMFFEPRLSSTGSMSCSNCHDPDHGFSSSVPLDDTANGLLNQRHTPSLTNLAYHEEFGWDGRAKPLEAHILGHWQGQLSADPKIATATLAVVPTYAALFQRAFSEAPSPNRSAEALAAFVRSLESGDSPWDRYEAGDATAVSEDAVDGFRVFNERAGCAVCHTPPLYTDLSYHHIDLPQSPVHQDLGRYDVSKVESDRAAFKTPTLRGVINTAPYLHDGSAKTLKDVQHAGGRLGGPPLSADEERQLMAFVEALTAPAEPFERPDLP